MFITMLPLAQLPTPAIAEISQYLSILECRQLVMSCELLWRNRKSIEGNRSVTALVKSSAEREVFEQVRPKILERLDLSDSVEDDYLMIFDWSVDFPSLREIAMEGADVQRGLRSLHGHPSLEHVNVVFCPKFEYRDALSLRESLLQPNAVVQRLPKELCGVVQTNFPNDQFHRYWPDGTFIYDRNEQSIGFVKLLLKNDSPRISSVLEYCDVSLPNFQGMEAFNPSVNLLPLGDGTNHVLVAQKLRDLRPPVGWPTLDQSTLPLGLSFYFDDDGIRSPIPQENSTVMITKMQVLPLDTPHPPDVVLKRIRLEVNRRTTSWRVRHPLGG